MSDRCFLKLFSELLAPFPYLKLDGIAGFHKKLYPGDFSKDGNFIVNFDVLNLVLNSKPSRNPPSVVGKLRPPHIFNTMNPPEGSNIFNLISERIHNSKSGMYYPIVSRELQPFKATIIPYDFNDVTKLIASYTKKNDPMASDSGAVGPDGKIILGETRGEKLSMITIRTDSPIYADWISTYPCVDIGNDPRLDYVTKYLTLIDNNRYAVIPRIDKSKEEPTWKVLKSSKIYALKYPIPYSDVEALDCSLLTKRLTSQ